MRSTRPASSSVVLNSWNEISRTSETDPRNAPAAATSRPVAAAFTKAGLENSSPMVFGPPSSLGFLPPPEPPPPPLSPFRDPRFATDSGSPGAPGLAGFPVPALGLKCSHPPELFLPPSAQNRAARERAPGARRAAARGRARGGGGARGGRGADADASGDDDAGRSEPRGSFDGVRPRVHVGGAPSRGDPGEPGGACDERVGELRGDGGGVPARERAFHDPGRGPHVDARTARSASRERGGAFREKRPRLDSKPRPAPDLQPQPPGRRADRPSGRGRGGREDSRVAC